VDPCEWAIIYGMRITERTVLAVLLAATLATLLLVARNGLAPVQHPVSFGLVLWAWVLLFYSAVGLAALALAGLVSKLTGLARLPGWMLLVATILFTAVALASNPRAVSSVLALGGPGLFRLLLPVSAALCALALVVVGAPLARGAGGIRIGVLIALASGLLSLLPVGGGGNARGGASPSARLQGLRFVVVGVDGADWRLMEPLMARGELPHFTALRDRSAWGPLETLRPTLSPAIWTSIVTGKLPRRHGVQDFATRRLRGVDNTLPDLRLLNRLGFPFLFARLEAAGQVFQAPITSFTRRVPAFWNITTSLGSPVSVINWWGTWPAEPVVGHVVSERAYYHKLLHPNEPDHPAGLTYPDDLYPRIAPLIARPDEVTLADAREFMDVTAAEFEPMRTIKHPSPLLGIANEFTYFHSMFVTNERLALDLVERSRRLYGQSADLLILLRLVDQTCHTALIYSDLVEDHRNASRDDLRKYAGVVSAAYRAADRALGRIQEASRADNVIVVSDHGFQLEGPRAFTHNDGPPGIFMAAGPAFRPGRVGGVSVLDILPLLLFLKDFPQAEDFDGQLPAQALDPALLASKPPRRIASYGTRMGPITHIAGSSAVDAEMLERLRALGYLK
jgi:type I phosphodiesterase/nucleotide pyrophosphatase